MEISQKEFDKTIIHPVQSFAWAQFRADMGYVEEKFEVNNKGYLVLFKKIPKTNRTIGILTQSNTLNKTVLGRLAMLGKKHQAIFIKIEPYIYESALKENPNKNFRKNLKSFGLVKSKDLYPRFSNIIDLTKSEKELLLDMKSKTRYNIGLAERKEVEVKIDREDDSFEEYLKLLEETTDRQAFYAHTKDYQRKMWIQMRDAGMAYIARAVHENETLSAWILFVFNDRLYYPYGASTRRKQNLMASYLLVWEAIRFGKRNRCNEFEMWGCLGPDPDKDHSWYGLTRFKTGFGGNLVEYVGAHDLILSPFAYKAYLLLDKVRWLWLKMKKSK